VLLPKHNIVDIQTDKATTALLRMRTES